MKVKLLAIAPEHAPAILRWLRDPHISGSLGLRSVPTLKKTQDFIERARSDASVCARAIVADNEHVGNVVLDHIDETLKKARLHIYIGAASARGRGVGQKAVHLALSLAFDELKLHKVWLTVHARNTIAIAAYANVGFQVEGIHRDEFMLGRERVNEVYMGILATEWRGADARSRGLRRKKESRDR